MNWNRGATGDWVSEDGKWRVRGPIMSRPMYWLYAVGVGRYTPTGKYEDAVSFVSATKAKRYAEQIK